MHPMLRRCVSASLVSRENSEEGLPSVKSILGALLVTAIGVTGCAEEGGAPFDRLDLRDALRADPEALARLDRAELETLAERLEDARSRQLAHDTLARTSAEDAIGYAVAYD